jgi:hypothetical protein
MPTTLPLQRPRYPIAAATRAKRAQSLSIDRAAAARNSLGATFDKEERLSLLLKGDSVFTMSWCFVPLLLVVVDGGPVSWAKRVMDRGKQEEVREVPVLPIADENDVGS